MKTKFVFISDMHMQAGDSDIVSKAESKNCRKRE